jgi:hypothetical protein
MSKKQIIVPPQVGDIIPIWGNAINRSLKDFIKWFNENYKVEKIEKDDAPQPK